MVRKDRRVKAGTGDPRIYLAAAKYQDPPAGSPATARPTIVPNSMHVLVYGINGK